MLGINPSAIEEVIKSCSSCIFTPKWE